MTNIELLLNRNKPGFIAQNIRNKFKKLRIIKNYTQTELAKRSGVTISSLKRFEQKAEISLMNLIKLAIILDATEGFETLFVSEPNTLNDFLKIKKAKERKRARKKSKNK